MLRNSQIFDKEGRVRLTSENKELKVIIYNGIQTQSLKDVVDKINEMVDDLSSYENMASFIFNCGLKMPKQPLPILNKYYRLRICYALEKDFTSTSWNEELETPNRMITSMENLIFRALRSKNTDILNDKMKEKEKLTSQIEDLNRGIEQKKVSIKNVDNEVKRKLQKSFLKSCYEKVFDTSNILLYELLSKKEKETYKNMIHSDKEIFNSMEYLRGLVVDEHKFNSKKKQLTNELNVLMVSIENMTQTIQDDAQREYDEEEEKVVIIQPAEVLDSWEDF